LTTGRAIPLLPARDGDETIAFYSGLGFELHRPFPGDATYIVGARGALEVHFFEYPAVEPLHNLGGCYLWVPDAQSLYEEWKPLALRCLAPTDTPWGTREFSVFDPSGNLIRIGSALRSTARGGAV
jgi:catechol 2,3-dioxygenase-like lactoylglutathione lyase family enzyme